MSEEASRRAFMKRLARYGYAAPVILTVLSRDARAELSGLPPDGDKQGTDPPEGRESPSPSSPPQGPGGVPASPGGGGGGSRPWYWWFERMFRF